MRQEQMIALKEMFELISDDYERYLMGDNTLESDSKMIRKRMIKEFKRLLFEE